jgi:hypothetical protein
VTDPNGAVANPAAPVTDLATVGADYQTWAVEAWALGRSWAATVIPGFDDHRVRNPSFLVERRQGGQSTYDLFWRIALQSRPDWVVITSFNEWHEGSEVEPSQEWTDSYLTATATWADRIHRCENTLPLG